jgi:hypothetical protein
MVRGFGTRSAVLVESQAMETQRMFGLEGMADLGSRTGVDMRSTLLRVLTDLYVHRLSHSPEEERHYTELALRLLDVVDVPTRVVVAKRFAHYLSPPLRVLHWLSRDVSDVARELRIHPLLQPRAGRHTAPGDTDLTTAIEKDTSADMATFSDLAHAAELNEQFFAANAAERRLILLNLNVVAPIGVGRVRVTRDLAVGQRLEAAVLAANRETFALELSQALAIPREQSRRIARDELGEPVVVAAKVLGMARDVLYRVLMFINPAVGHSVERVHALAALNDEMTLPAAEGMVAIWQALPRTERVDQRHRPLMWDDAAPPRRARAGAAAALMPRTAAAATRRREAS